MESLLQKQDKINGKLLNWESIQGPPVSQANACTAKKWDMIKENESDVAD